MKVRVLLHSLYSFNVCLILRIMEFDPTRRKLILGSAAIAAEAALSFAGRSTQLQKDIPISPQILPGNELENWELELTYEHALQEKIRLEAMTQQQFPEGPRLPSLEWYTSQVPRKLLEHSQRELLPRRPDYDNNLLQKPVFRVETDEPIVGLTTDDGFYNQPEFVKLYKEKRVGATLFIITQNLQQHVVEQVHETTTLELGNHYNHSDVTKNTDGQTLAAIKEQEDILSSWDKKFVVNPYVRPFGGNKNLHSNQLIAGAGNLTIEWNISGDAGSYTPDELVGLYRRQFEAQQRNGSLKGSIILTHFTPATLAAVGQIIDVLRKDFNVEPVSLSQLFSSAKAIITDGGIRIPVPRPEKTELKD